MGMNVEHTRALTSPTWASRMRPASVCKIRRGAPGSVNTIRHMLGVCDENGSHYTN